jgi:DNA-binding response OmpR family regulator
LQDILTGLFYNDPVKPENWTMSLQTQPTILLIGRDRTLRYLLARFAEHSGYQWKVSADKVSTSEITASNPAVVIFLSIEFLDTDQSLVTELANLDAPILVCSSVLEEARARKLGADYCLLHPLTYDGFQAALAKVTASKHA